MARKFAWQTIMTLSALFVLVWSLESRAQNALPSSDVVNCYLPVEGGLRISLRAEPNAAQVKGDSIIGVTKLDPYKRTARRPLYPPADKSLIWSEQELEKIQRSGFRPLVMAYLRPRFMFDFHSAGGALGHLYLGLIKEDGQSKWFHEFSNIDFRYIDGRAEYIIQDSEFADITVSLTAAALPQSAGGIIKLTFEGKCENCSFVWGYGGASAFFSNYNFIDPEWNFSPKHCKKDLIRWNNSTFTLQRAFDESDTYVKEIFAAACYLPDWKAKIMGASSWDSGWAFGDPETFAKSPKELVESAEWITTNKYFEKKNCVALESINLTEKNRSGFVVVGMGGNIADVVRRPVTAFDEALKRNQEIAERVVTKTPDPYLDSAVRMMAFATDGCWGDTALLHGGFSWRFAYLGWRSYYGPNAYGWTNRVKKSIQNHIRLSLVKQGQDKGALGSLIEYNPNVYYNMNEVFLDHVRHYFEYTDDLEFMREIFPVLKGIVEWESRRLQPENEYLYENALNTWISDAHWYIGGQCTQASSYMLQANNFLAGLAKRLDENHEPFRERARLIRSAMQRKLWMPRKGVFAEYLDTRGNRMLHTEPELPTIYHSAEFGAADPLRIYQMLHWADNNLRQNSTAGDGKLYWSSNWFPNRGRTYTHSTYELAYAEELNFALTNYLVGRSDVAYSIIRACLCGIYSSPTPGGLPCHCTTEGLQRANDEFADSISMWGRTIVEGLFGIVPKRPDGLIKLSPQFPKDWEEASIRTRLFTYEWQKQNGKISINWSCPFQTRVDLHLPLRTQRIENVRVSNEVHDYEFEAGVGLTWLNLVTPQSRNGTIEIEYWPAEISEPSLITVKQKDPFQIDLTDYHATDWLDPQGILGKTRIEDGTLKGVVNCEAGPALIFLAAQTGACPIWIPVRIKVEPKAGPVTTVWASPNVHDKSLDNWVLLNIEGIFNTSLTEVPKQVSEAAHTPDAPSSQVGFGYWKSYLVHTYHGGDTVKLSDAAWRKKAGDDNVAWTTENVPFKTSKTGSNIAVVTLAGGFPSKLEFPVAAKGKTLYLMISGVTFPSQSHVVNLRVTLCYKDDTEVIFDLTNPFDIGDCWGTWCGRWHDTPANGFENIGGRKGPAGSAEVDDISTPIDVGDTEAHLVPFDLKPSVELTSVKVEAIANDVVFGVMGASILRR